MQEMKKVMLDREKKFEYLSKLRLEFGIFDEYGSKEEEITVYNLDGTIRKEKMTLSDIMYLTEKGTINLPAQPILDRIARKIEYEFPFLMREISEGIIVKNWGENQIREKIHLFTERINLVFIPNAIGEQIASNNVINGILNEEENEKYTFDLKKLKKFIKCKYFFTI